MNAAVLRMISTAVDAVDRGKPATLPGNRPQCIQREGAKRPNPPTLTAPFDQLGRASYHPLLIYKKCLSMPDTVHKPSPSGKSIAKPGKKPSQEQLAQALRDNLRRRKTQAQTRADQKPSDVFDETDPSPQPSLLIRGEGAE